MGPNSPLESQWPDNVARERRLLREHPEWTIKRLRSESFVTTYEATDGTVTLKSLDLGSVLDLIERAMRDGD